MTLLIYEIKKPKTEIERIANKFKAAALLMGVSAERVAENIKHAVEAMGRLGNELERIEELEALRRARAYQGVWIFGDWKYGDKT